MYIVRWVDEQDLPAASLLFTKNVSSNICISRHVMSQIETSPEWLAKYIHKDTNCLKLVCSNAKYEDNVMFSQIDACKRIDLEEAWEIMEQWHYEAAASMYHWYQFRSRFFLTERTLRRSPLCCFVHFQRDANGKVRPNRRPIKKMQERKIQILGLTDGPIAFHAVVMSG